MVGVLNAPLYAFFARHGGVRFSIAAVALHGLYLLYSSAVFVGMAAATWLRAPGAALARVRAPSRARTERSLRVK